MRKKGEELYKQLDRIHFLPLLLLFLASPQSLSFFELPAPFFTKQKQDPGWQELPWEPWKAQQRHLFPNNWRQLLRGPGGRHGPCWASGCHAPSPLLARGQHLHDLVPVPFYPPWMHPLSSDCFYTRLDSHMLWEGCGCICEPKTKKWYDETDSCLFSSPCPTCLVLKGTGETL